MIGTPQLPNQFGRFIPTSFAQTVTFLDTLMAIRYTQVLLVLALLTCFALKITAHITDAKTETVLIVRVSYFCMLTYSQTIICILTPFMCMTGSRDTTMCTYTKVERLEDCD